MGKQVAHLNGKDKFKFKASFEGDYRFKFIITGGGRGKLVSLLLDEKLASQTATQASLLLHNSKLSFQSIPLT